MGALSDEDIESYNDIKRCRNHIAHNLFTALARDGLPSDFENNFTAMRQLVRKIELWWIVEVEMSINSDFDGIDVPPESIMSGTEIGLSLLADIAFGDGKLTQEAFEHFCKISKNSS